MDPEERLEDPLEVHRRDARPAVSDLHEGVSFDPDRGHVDDIVRSAVADGVVDEVEDDPAEIVRIRRHRQVRLQDDLRPGDRGMGRRVFLDRFGRQNGQVDDLRPRLDQPLVRPCEQQQVVGQAGQAPRGGGDPRERDGPDGRQGRPDLV